MNEKQSLTPRFVRQERAHGKWTKRQDKLYCSICGAKALSRNLDRREKTDNYQQIKSPFCPFCGADMRDDKSHATSENGGII